MAGEDEQDLAVGGAARRHRQLVSVVGTEQLQHDGRLGPGSLRRHVLLDRDGAHDVVRVLCKGIRRVLVAEDPRADALRLPNPTPPRHGASPLSC